MKNTFRQWSYKTSVSLFDAAFAGPDEDAAKAFQEKPYAWFWLLIPICGLCFFYGVVCEYRMKMRWDALRTRKTK